jgi:hypothetical protein
MRRAARRRVAIEASKAAGCRCNLKILGTHKDELGLDHVTVAHDDGCQLSGTSMLAMYQLPPGCER